MVLIYKIFHCDVCLMKAVVFVCLFSLSTGIEHSWTLVYSNCRADESCYTLGSFSKKENLYLKVKICKCLDLMLKKWTIDH